MHQQVSSSLSLQTMEEGILVSLYVEGRQNFTSAETGSTIPLCLSGTTDIYATPYYSLFPEFARRMASVVTVAPSRNWLTGDAQ
jgi:hypothetical protein